MENMSEIVVRPMLPADYDQVVELWGSTEGIGLSEADECEPLCRYLRRNPELSLVATADGRLAGAVLCGHDGRRGYLHHLAVALPYRIAGTGRRLVEACLVKLGQEKIDKCHIFVYPDNEQGLAFWRQMGFARRDDIQLCSRGIILGLEKGPGGIEF